MAQYLILYIPANQDVDILRVVSGYRARCWKPHPSHSAELRSPKGGLRCIAYGNASADAIALVIYNFAMHCDALQR